MTTQAHTADRPGGEVSQTDRPVAVITVHPQDLRPLVPRRWSATVVADDWAFDDPSFGAYYWGARSKERLVAKAVRDLRKRLDNPVIVVSVPEGYSGADFGLDQAPPIAARRFGGEIRASGVTAVE